MGDDGARGDEVANDVSYARFRKRDIHRLCFRFEMSYLWRG
jgi:hypothetical protein